MRTLVVIAIATLLAGVTGCAETRTVQDKTLGEDTRTRTTETSPPAPVPLPQQPRPVLNR